MSITLLEINKLVSGVGLYENKTTPYLIDQERSKWAELLQEIIYSDDDYAARYGLTENYAEFYKVCELAKDLIPKDKQSDAFYDCLLGFFYEGVPGKLTFLLNKALRKYDTPNNAISSIAVNSLKPYFEKNAMAEGITIKKVMESLLGTGFNLLSLGRRSVKYNKCYEVYVPNTNRVAILPESFADYLASNEDLETLAYVKDRGIELCGKLLRTMDRRQGITRDEYDLRECF